MILLQKRDREILRLCYEQQFLFTDHVLGLFKNRSYRECRRRIAELRQAGFLREELASVLGRRPVLRLTQLGTQAAIEGGGSLVPQTKRLQPATLLHDAYVTGVRVRLEEFWPSARFIPERAIKKSEYRQIPDGIFTFPSGRGVAIEVENSDKGRTRFIQLMERWRDVGQIILVLYVATSDSLYQTVQRYLEAGPKDQPMGVVSWNVLSTGRPPVLTPKGELPLFERSEF